MTDEELAAISQRLDNLWTDGDTYSDIQPPADVATLLAEVQRLREIALHCDWCAPKVFPDLGS